MNHNILHPVSRNGGVVQSEVKSFLMKEKTVTSIYKSITTALNKTITLSGSHLIYARRLSTDHFMAV